MKFNPFYPETHAKPNSNRECCQWDSKPSENNDGKRLLKIANRRLQFVGLGDVPRVLALKKLKKTRTRNETTGLNETTSHPAGSRM